LQKKSKASLSTPSLGAVLSNFCPFSAVVSDY
jgi:hypothetical protein